MAAMSETRGFMLSSVADARITKPSSRHLFLRPDPTQPLKNRQLAPGSGIRDVYKQADGTELCAHYAMKLPGRLFRLAPAGVQ